MPKVVSAGHATLRRIVGPASGAVVVVPLCPDGDDDAEALGVSVALAEGEGVGDAGEGVGDAGEAVGEGVGATQPASRRDEGKAAIEWEARSQKPVLPDRARAPRSASPSGSAMSSFAAPMRADTKASDWRSRERCAGSVAVGAGVGVGEGDGLGEAVAAPDCPDWVLG